MRLTRVRYSLAEYTPTRFSPGIFMKLGSPAPVPMKKAEKPWALRSSKVAVRPTTKFILSSTPSFLR